MESMSKIIRIVWTCDKSVYTIGIIFVTKLTPSVFYVFNKRFSFLIIAGGAEMLQFRRGKCVCVWGGEGWR